ncbi:MAG: GspH/FimT family pseudopilin [Betaproteobacteria bacterium]|nr:GspH/FimT family pseudopilin [Betaproteobacteria bacterium]
MDLRMRGVTLVECLVVMALTAICLGMALPAWRDALRAQRVREASQALVDGLRMARLHALQRGGFVRMCPGGPGGPGGGCEGAGRWEQGWVLLGEPSAQGGEAPVLGVAQALRGVRIDADAALARGAGFDAGGWPRRPGGALLMGRWRVCPQGGGAGRELVLSAAGRVRGAALDCLPD